MLIKSFYGHIVVYHFDECKENAILPGLHRTTLHYQTCLLDCHIFNLMMSETTGACKCIHTILSTISYFICNKPYYISFKLLLTTDDMYIQVLISII